MDKKISKSKEELTQVIDTLQKTRTHVKNVQETMFECAKILMTRALKHDDSKFDDVELEGFSQVTHKLSKTEYDSEEYHAVLENELKTALNHHYANNRHHPEHFKDGLNNMTFFDLIEMLCDWMDACKRQEGGNIRKSLEANTKRFGIDSQLGKIFENTIVEMMGDK